MMTLVLLRVDLPGTLAHLRRPAGVAAIIAFQLLVSPVLAWLVVSPLALDRGIAGGIVLFACGCAATSSPAFARMVGLDPDLSLIVSLATTALVPLTAPPLALWLMGIDLSISAGAFMARLLLVVGLPTLRLAGAAPGHRPRPARRAMATRWTGCWSGWWCSTGSRSWTGSGRRSQADPGWVLVGARRRLCRQLRPEPADRAGLRRRSAPGSRRPPG